MTVLCAPDGTILGELDFAVPASLGPVHRAPLYPPERFGVPADVADADILVWAVAVERGHAQRGGARVAAFRFIDQESLKVWREWRAAWERTD